MRVAVIVAGVVLGLGSLVLSGLYALIIGFGCSGTDAGEPPSADSIGDTLCDSPALPVGLWCWRSAPWQPRSGAP
jgi:hypothetical protein